MFKGISTRIALQFTAFVFVLLLLNGALFLAADFGNARRQLNLRMTRDAQFMVQSMPSMMTDPGVIPPRMRDRIRVMDALGTPIFGGEFFNDVPFTSIAGFSEAEVQGENYTVLTAPVLRNGQRVGFIQIAALDRLPLGGLPPRAFLYIVVSILISFLTFVVGHFFARTSLRPAEDVMRRLEQFTQDASHELRTPLAALNSSLDLALRTEKFREGIESAKDDVRNITVLIDRLLDLARLDAFALEKAPVDLSALLSDAVNKHALLATEKGIVIKKDIAPGVTVIGDAALLRQVIGNLLANATKFGKRNGEIIARLTQKELSIRDDGIGIPAAAITRIFDRFYQADNSRAHGGFGLGLALVKRIVDLHGWSIAVKSREGQGATFMIIFPSHS